jgi:PAS domain S-box-containing protein
MFGYSRAELLGKETRVHHASEEDFAQLGRQACAQIAGTGAFSADSRMPRKNGTLIWVQLDGTALSRDHS